MVDLRYIRTWWITGFWLVDWLIDWLVWLVDWLIDGLPDLVDSSSSLDSSLLMVDPRYIRTWWIAGFWLVDWLIGWFDWLTGWLIDWWIAGLGGFILIFGFLAFNGGSQVYQDDYEDGCFWSQDHPWIWQVYYVVDFCQHHINSYKKHRIQFLVVSTILNTL